MTKDDGILVGVMVKCTGCGNIIELKPGEGFFFFSDVKHDDVVLDFDCPKCSGWKSRARKVAVANGCIKGKIK